MKVVSLHRYAVKGLSGDALSHVYVQSAGETFPDDRRYALKTIQPSAAAAAAAVSSSDCFQEGEWRHKGEFVCAFTAPELLAHLQTSYSVHSNLPASDHSRAYPWDAPSNNNNHHHRHHRACRTSSTTTNNNNKSNTVLIRRLLSIRDRCTGLSLVHPPLDLAVDRDRRRLSDFLGAYTNRDVVCWVATGATTTTTTRTTDSTDTTAGSEETTTTVRGEVLQGNRLHTHQFGNTSSGYKQRGDTRTIHLIHQHTVNALGHKIQQQQQQPPNNLNPLRFRPNIVLDETDTDNNDESSTSMAFCEFDWIGKQLQVVPVSPSLDDPPPFTMTVLTKTVRCQGVSVDPQRLYDPPLDIPALLVQHFPQHGPYLGVYATIDTPGFLRVGDTLQVLN